MLAHKDKLCDHHCMKLLSYSYCQLLQFLILVPHHCVVGNINDSS